MEVAKNSKAQEIHGLKKQVEAYQMKIQEMDEELRNDKSVIERFNREKVNMLRENTVREDVMRKMEQDKKNLEKEKKTLQHELGESQHQVTELLKFLDMA